VSLENTGTTVASTELVARRKWFEGRNLVVLLAVFGLAVMSSARVIADADRLTSSGTIGLGLRLAIPIALAGIGGLYAERSGTVNIGLEGMMVMGTIMAGYFGWQYGPVAALIAGAFGGILAGLLLGMATATFGVNHIVAGFAINIIAPGVARFLANQWFTTPEASALGGSVSNGPPVDGQFPKVSLPVLSSGPDLLGDLEEKGWWLISDAAGILRGLTSDLRLDTIIAVVLIVGTSYLVWHTPFGLRLRAAGEKPGAADSLGVSVIRMRYYGVILSGALAGMGGAVLVFAGANRYQQGQTLGQGYLGLAALVFGNWMPAGTFGGAGVFGYANGIRLSIDASTTVKALILAVGIALALFAVWSIVKRNVHAAVISAIVAVLAFVVYAVVDEINNQFIYMTPYVVTLLVVTLFAQRLRPPAAEGIPYRKGDSL
jgi:general nucleoside transport system permease protein